MPLPVQSTTQSTDAVTTINKYRQYVTILADPSSHTAEARLKAAQEISENFEVIISSPHYPTFLETAIPRFVRVLKDESPVFIAESQIQQLRKLLLEIIHRIPTNDHLRVYVPQVLELMFFLLDRENEENVLVCLRVIIELHKQFRPHMAPEKTLEGLPISPTPDALNIQLYVERPGFATQVVITINQSDGSKVQQTILPRGINSLKVLAEYPIIVVLMYQLYKQTVHSVVAEFIPLIMNTIVLQPSQQARSSAHFNKEMYVDFVAAQIKTLSFLAYIIKIYQELVNSCAPQMVKGILGLFQHCPSEVAHLRKELLIAVRHILATDLRNRFVPSIDKLFEESVLVGSGWTSKESLRPLAYSTLADLVHHVRQHLPLQHLSLAVHLFSKNVHDESLPCSIQTMSCKLLLNLVDCIRTKSEQEHGNGREILMRMLEVFVLKFHTIAKNQLPPIFKKVRSQANSSSTTEKTVNLSLGVTSTQGTSSESNSTTVVVPSTPSSTAPPTPGLPQSNLFQSTSGGNGATTPGVTVPGTPLLGSDKDKDKEIKEEVKPKTYLPTNSAQHNNYTVTDCRNLVKTVICGVKTITWGVSSCKSGGAETSFAAQNKQFHPKETAVFVKLVKYALQALDIYQIQVSATGQLGVRPANTQSVRLKEEKEVLEHFAGVFTMMHPLTFKEIYTTTIDFVVERIHQNFPLQIVANAFLANPTTSATFATILVEYLLNRLEEMGTNLERSNLYLKLFKLVFGSVSLFAAENEQMLKPHLHKIVNRSMELATTAKEPYNYFLLLRALFRSIGGGSHDQLYQEFLPLLPNLLQGLNQLQSGLHKQHMKDLFVELCLTVPVRLSSLLPYLPMLMDPLVSALNGSQTLVSQGLRTLELCVDNLQPDFLYEHIQPVRAELMQAIWRTLRNRNDSIAQVAFRVLGKFGGGNRKMLKEPQKLNYRSEDTDGPCIVIYFQDHKIPIYLKVSKIIESALDALKSPSTDAFYRKQAWEVVRHFLVSMIMLDDNRQMVQQLLSHSAFTRGEIPRSSQPMYKCSDTLSRKACEQALTAMIVASTIKDLRTSALPFMVNLVCHFTFVSITQQAGPLPISNRYKVQKGMDPHVIIDAIATCMAHTEKELCKTSQVALTFMIDTATSVLGSKERACSLPIFDYLVEKMCGCCYERAWYAKLGGCIAIKFMMEKMSTIWVFNHLYQFLKAIFFVMMDLTKEVSSGALDHAKTDLEALLQICASDLSEEDAKDPNTVEAKKKAFRDVTKELVREATSPNQTVREQAMNSLRQIAVITGKSVTDIMDPHKEVLADMIPPKKHLLRHQPANAQMGLMDGNTFCTTLQPRLFTINLEIMEHKVFFTELMNLCEAEDAVLSKLPCYKSVTSLIPLRIGALKALAACFYIPQVREKIFNTLYKALNSSNPELQEAGTECMKKFIAGHPVDMELVRSNVRPLLSLMGDHRSLNLNVIKRLHSLTQLFPNAFNEKLCEQLLAHLKKWLEVSIIAMKGGNTRTNAQSIKICSAILNMFHTTAAASLKLLEPLVILTIRAEKVLMMEIGSPLRKPLIKYLVRYPQQTVDFFLHENNLKEQQYNKLFAHMLKQGEAVELRKVVQSNQAKLVNLAFAKTQPTARPNSPNSLTRLELQYQTILIISILVKYSPDWLPKQPVLANHLKRIWTSDQFQERHRVDNVGVIHWNEPKLLVKCLLNYIEHHAEDIELLFQLLRVFTNRYLPNFVFFRNFLEDKVAQGYSVNQKRQVFLKFVELFHDQNFPQILKGKALQFIIIPMFAASFDKKEGEELIGGPPNPSGSNPNNLVNIFIEKVIDPDNPYGTSDSTRILLLQFAALLVEHAAPHIHDAADRKQGSKLRRLMTFAWPCLIHKNCVDPATKYHGHLLLSHIIAKFAIHKRIVLQVFHSLLKAHAPEARSVVRQALEILTPALPTRMEEGNTMLTHWTKKIIVEEGHTVAQLVHMLQLLVKHFKVYYPVRHHLIQNMVNSVQRLGFTPNATLEHRKLAVDLAEVIIKWEVRRIKEHDTNTETMPVAAETGTPAGAAASTSATAVAGAGALKRPASLDSAPDPKRVRNASGTVTKTSISVESSKAIDKHYSDAVVNFLLRIACQVNEASSAAAGQSGEQLSRRCIMFLKTALRPDVWPKSELKLNFMEKLFLSVEQSTSVNYGNVCAGLEILSFLLSVMKKPMILSSFKPLQRGIAACLTCSNSKVIRAVHTLLTKLMSLFPTESSTSTVASKHEELECLYASVGKVIYEGLNSYEKAATGTPTSSLFGTLMILKAACTNNVSYIDRLISVFMRALTKMTREHLSPSAAGDGIPVASELLVISLDLVKNRVGVMSNDMKRNFIQIILSQLIEKSSEPKVLKTIVKMVEDWIKIKTQIMMNQSPALRDKSILLVKLMQYVESRFPDELELHAQFLDLVNFVYRDESLAASELTAKLEPAFLSGLRCKQPHIRAKFFSVFNHSIKKRLFDRLLYITASQNWESMQSHYWLKKCIELIMAVTVSGLSITTVNSSQLPAITSVIGLADSHDKTAFTLALQMKEEPMDVESVEDIDVDVELNQPDGSSFKKSSDNKQTLSQLITRQMKFLEQLREFKTFNFLTALSNLCHNSTNLSHSVWIDMFPKLWKILSEKQQTLLSQEIGPFLCSGSHHHQKDCNPSTINTMLEAVAQCVPTISIRPCVLKYLSKTHNLWHRSVLILEQQAIESGFNMQHKPRNINVGSVYDFFEPDNTASLQQETLDSLAGIYELLEEEDMWAGLWQKRCKFPDTATGIAYEQQGFYEQAQQAYESAMMKARSDHNSGSQSPSVFPEYRLWEEHWIKCSKELGQWDLLMDYGNSKVQSNPHLVLESAWRVPNWGAMKESLAKVELSCPREMNWKVNLYRGYIAICHPDERNLNLIERLVEMSSSQAIKEWRRLPSYVTQAHTPILQAAHRIMELQEAAQIHQGLQPSNIGRNQSIHDMKAIVKTWRNRLPMVSDDLSHWSDIFMWRQHHYQAIVSAYDNQATSDPQHSSHAMLGVHASAQSIINYGKVARKHSLIGPALDSLSRIHTIPSVPIIDCFQKIRQQVKCYLQMAGTMGKQELQEGLEVIESTNLKYFNKEMTAEFYALKGMFLAQVGRSDEANKAFSAAVQMHDTLVKAWALWGDYLEQIFTKEKQINVGVSAIVCFLHACRHQNESKSRKYLAKVLWLLTFDDEKNNLPLADAVDKYAVGIPAFQWLPWIPQLLTCLVGCEGKIILNLLVQVGRVYPQAVYFPIRTLYLTLKIEQRERYKSGELLLLKAKAASNDGAATSTDGTSSKPPATIVKTEPNTNATKDVAQPTTKSAAEAKTTTASNSSSTTGSTTAAPSASASSSSQGPIRATAPMWRCSKIMQIQRDLHPTLLSSLEGIVDQMVWFRETWYEEVLRQLKQALAKCQAVAFENRGAVAEAKVTPHMLSFVKKLVSTFGVGIENVSSVATTFSSAASESLARRVQATSQDPIFQRLKNQFTLDFDFSVPGSTKLHNLIHKLKKWIKTLEVKCKLLPKSFLIEEKCRFLSNFSSSTADVDLPGEFLVPKHNHYYIRIARFMPTVQIVQKHNTSARRLYIRGSNGKIYPYLVVNNACLGESRREERVLQLLRMLNHFLAKRKATAKRQLQFTVPRVVAVSPQMRLVQDSPTSLSLLDIYKQRCSKLDEYDTPILRYYDRLQMVQARGSQASHQVLRDILKEVQTNMVPRGMLKEWAVRTYPNATDYFAFRKMFTGQLALLGLAEFVLHLTRLNPDILQVEQDTGQLSVFYFRFDIDDTTGELDANRPVPFRLTPNIAEFLTSVGINGLLSASMISIARCLVQPNFQLVALLRAILRDEMIAWDKKKQDDALPAGSQPMNMKGELLNSTVMRAVNIIMTRLQNLAQFEGGESKISTLVAAANSPDNLCRMDPAWHPWL
ncbi:transformation/transcription domain-associated protein-like isoform X1 [Anneissia japonica]|uniref:transformation/transcription domain-associated protein-like isoform X1 n=1 Tax=Anneissia japonica TaxID=1529436 RepID=UPI0014255820|nr:transformation/transcription domain-associated protein-like isoform X1 [Anneissia japonica]